MNVLDLSLSLQSVPTSFCMNIHPATLSPSPAHPVSILHIYIEQCIYAWFMAVKFSSIKIFDHIYNVKSLNIGTEGSVQLYNSSSSEGRIIEYCRGGFWRAVCDVNWSYQNSFVVCRQLGLPATGMLDHCTCRSTSFSVSQEIL